MPRTLEWHRFTSVCRGTFVLPSNFLFVNRLGTHRTFPPGFITQGEIMQQTRPAVDVSTTGDLAGLGFGQADGTFHCLHRMQSNLFDMRPVDG